MFDSMHEIWGPVRGFPNYAVSNYGRVRNRKSGAQLNPTRLGNGYLRVQLWCKKEPTSFGVHRLVADVFLDEDISDKQVDHKNNVKTHNFVWNLQVVTPSENVKLTYTRGRALSNAKSVRIIQTGEKFESISRCAMRLDVCPRALARAIHGKKDIADVSVRFT